MTPAQRAAAKLNSKGRRIQAQRRAESRQLRIEPNVRLRPCEITALANEALSDEQLDELIWGHAPLLDRDDADVLV